MDSALVDLFGSDDYSDEDTNVMETMKLPPEIEEGNIEYKLKLIDPSPTRFEHLVTQMKWRLQEGSGEAIYEIGVEDNGYLSGLTDQDMQNSLRTLHMMAERLGASVTTIRERTIDNGSNQMRKSAELLIRKVPDDQQFIDLRVAVLGNSESGKSTSIGVLTYDELDNGRGRARLNLFRHLHEIQSGHTSSINHEILGFSNTGQVKNYGNCRSADEIFENSSKIITFIDLAGQQRYMKTTIFGLSTNAPDFVMLVISANNGIAGTTKEHLGYSLALKVPVFIVVNKIDNCSQKLLDETLSTIQYLIKSPGCSKVPLVVANDDDAVYSAQNIIESNICPIFTISCVNGEHLDLLKKFLNVLPPLINKTEREKLMQEYAEFRIDEICSVQSVGNIVAGMLVKGIIQERDNLVLGPFDNGEFFPVKVQSVHRHRVPLRIIRAGQSAAVNLKFSIEKIADKLRKGMVLISEKLEPHACFEFEANIYVLYHANQICKGFQVTIHIGNVCQTATIKSMDKTSVRTNEQAKAVFKFHSRPEYLTIGSRLIFRAGASKGLGEITGIIYTSNPYLEKSENMKNSQVPHH